MYKKILIVVLIIVFLIIARFGSRANNQSSPGNITSQPVSIPTPTPNVPKQIKFDKSTDLIKELELIDPQILDSDF